MDSLQNTILGMVVSWQDVTGNKIKGRVQQKSWLCWLGVWLAITVAACVSPARFPAVTPTLDKTSTPRPLLFLGNKNIAPVLYLDGTAPAGVAVDLVRALARHLPQPVEIRAMDWSEAQALVTQEEADALIQINVTEERKELYDFSDPFLESHFSIFVRSEEMGISGISGLRGLQVGVEAGGLPQQLLAKDPQIHLSIIPDFLEGFNLLSEGTIDAVVVDYRVGSYVLAQNGIRNIKMTGEPIQSSYSSIAVKKGNTELLQEINGALRTIKADGTYQKILNTWGPTEGVFETQEQISGRVYLATTLVLLTLLLITVLWALTTHRQLQARRVAEEKLKEHYSTLQGIIDNTNTLIFSVDKRYRYTSFNQEHAAVMKVLYAADIELGESILEYMAAVPQDREATRHRLERALGGEPCVEEAYSGNELYSRQYFRLSHSPIRIETGEVIGVAVLAQDLTERKHSEEALHRLNRELRALSNCNQTLLRAVDEQTLLKDICRIVCDEAGYRMAWVGYAQDDDGKGVQPVAWAGNEAGYLSGAQITWADTERGRGPTGLCIRNGKSACIQDLMTDPQAVIWREGALQRGYRSNIALPLKDEKARTFGALTIYSTDPNAFTPDEIRLLEELAGDLAFGITVLRTRSERQQAEEVLRISDGRYRMAQAIGRVGNWEYNVQTTHFWGSDEAKRLYGFDPGQPNFSTGQVENCIPERQRVHQALVDLIEADKPYNLEFEIHPLNSSEPRVIASIAQLQRDEQGHPWKVVGVIQDITGRKRAEQEIQKLNRELERRVLERTAQLEAANKDLEAFAYSVSHDLRAPLRHIDGFLELLQKRTATVVDEQSRHYMDTIAEAARRMGMLIDDLLSFSRMGREGLSKSAVSLDELVQEVLGELRPEMEGREICWKISPLPLVHGDRAMLRLVWVNLIANALKFTRLRSPAEIEIGWKAGDDKEVVVFIGDNGVGFDMKYVDRLFGVFQRLHRADEFEGTGIGLASVRRVIHRHGGRTWAEGEADHGATFYFSLPQATPE